MKDGFRRLLHKRGVGGIKNSQKMKFAFFDCFYVMLPLKKGVHYKRFDQILLVAQFQAGIDRFGDGDHNLLILHLAVTVFADQQQDVIDVDFDLLDQFHFKDDVIVDNVLRRLLSLPVLMVEIEIDALVILPVPLRKNFQLGRVYRRTP